MKEERAATHGDLDKAAPAASDARTVLLVEDDPDHEELIRRALHDRDASVDLRVTRHGEEALDYLLRRGVWADAARSPRPRLVLMDLRLPRLDGFHVLGAIKSAPRLRCIPVVVLTTSQYEPDVAQAYAAHANSYLVKPADFTQLTDLLDGVARYWLRLNRQPVTPGPS